MVRLRMSLVFVAVLFAVNLSAQVEKKIKEAYLAFEKDSQLSHAISSLYVIDAQTGSVIFDKNSQIGLAGASTQKVITAATAFEKLGKEFRFETDFYQSGKTLSVVGGGDPSLGSFRYASTNPGSLFQMILEVSNKKLLAPIENIQFINSETSDQLAPAGWINEDMGNYYGAGIHAFNWNENQYDLVMIPSKLPGGVVKIDTMKTAYWKQFVVECITGPVGSGDNGYIYFVPGDSRMLVKGTIPAGVDRFTISGADPYPDSSFARSFSKYTGKNLGITRSKRDSISSAILLSYYSPSLDSIIYWFLKKSINLYGEALLRPIGSRTRNSEDSGLVAIKEFWKEHGIDPTELNIYDGSGLSPLNRLTTHAQVEVLKYAKGKDWFPYYLTAFPEYNGIKMKSGTINNVKGYCGYHKSKEGKEYIFSFLVNNYNGGSSSLVNKMFRVLDVLK